METRNRIAAHLDTPHFDERTGLFSREGLVSRLRPLAALASRTRRGILLVAADLEGLRRINESFGRLEGDAALARAADLLQGTFRKSDVIACCGGDDFIVATVETRQGSAEVISRRLRENLRRLNETGDGRYALSLHVAADAIDAESVSMEELTARVAALQRALKASGSVELN